MNSVECLTLKNLILVMTNTKRLATIFVLTAILITGSLNAVQYAYSSGPDVLTVKYSGPIGLDPAETIIQIYKKIDDFASLPLDEISIEADGEVFMVFASNYGKDKLNSNTVFRIIERTTGSDDDEIDVVEIHTSCSKPLYKGQMVPGVNAIVTLEVIDGTLGLEMDSIIPDNESEKCLDNKKPKHTATITLKKAITNDNGGEITDPLTFTANFLPKIDDIDVSFGDPITITTKEPHIISEADVPGYSFVLIAGDTECPSMLGEEFTLKKNKDITCTIYNDDNFDPNAGGTGVTFGHRGFEIRVDDDNSPGAPDNEIGPRPCSEGETPCVEFVEVNQGGVGLEVYLIVDDELVEPTNNILVIWSLIPTGSNTFVPVSCLLVGIYDSSITGKKGFALECSEIANKDFNINYAFIRTVFSP